MRFFFTSLISVQQFTIHSIPPERENHQAVSKRVWFKTTPESPACPAFLAILLYKTGSSVRSLVVAANPSLNHRINGLGSPYSALGRLPNHMLIKYELNLADLFEQ